MRMSIASAAASMAFLVAPSWGSTTVLDFSGDICGPAGDQACASSSQIGANYGDVTGLLDVGYRSYIVSSGATYESFLKYWPSGYSNLVGVAWGGANQTGYGSEITLTPGAGQAVRLNSFDFGDYQNSNTGSSVRIFDGGGNVLLWDGGSFDPGAVATGFAPAIGSSNGLVLRWGPDAWNVGIDNISVTVVPEPAGWILLLAGLGALVGLGRASGFSTLRRE